MKDRDGRYKNGLSRGWNKSRKTGRVNEDSRVEVMAKGEETEILGYNVLGVKLRLKKLRDALSDPLKLVGAC